MHNPKTGVLDIAFTFILFDSSILFEVKFVFTNLEKGDFHYLLKFPLAKVNNKIV